MFSPTEAMLIRCVDCALRGDGIVEAPSNVLWPEFLRLAREHGVLHRLADAPSLASVLPADVLSEARAERMSIAQRNLFLAAELERVVGLFDHCDIDLIAFKGVVAAKQFHGNLAERPSGDLDLLVRRRHHARAADALTDVGYRRVADHPDSLQSVFENPQRATTIDLHWGIPPTRPPLRLRTLWRHRTKLPLLATDVPTFEARTAIAIAAINTVKNYWDVSLRQIVEFRVAASGLTDHEWRAVLRRSKQIGCRRFLSAAVHVCASVFPAALPASLMVSAERDPIARRIADEILAHLFEDAGGAMTPRVFASRTDYEAALDDRRFAEFWERLSRLVTPSAADRAWLALPQRFQFAYYALRPIRLLLRGRHRERTERSRSNRPSVSYGTDDFLGGAPH